MKREIKFRAKRIDDPKQFEYGYIRVDGTDVWMHTLDGRVMLVIPETVGQFTGLHDKNGEEIYEGDIVKCNGLDWTYTVVFYTTAFILYRPDGYYFTIYKDDWFEVIGNIYDNKESLTQN